MTKEKNILITLFFLSFAHFFIVLSRACDAEEM